MGLKHIFNCFENRIPSQAVFEPLYVSESKILFFGMNDMKFDSDDFYVILFDKKSEEMEMLTSSKVFEEPIGVVGLKEVGGKYYCCDKNGQVYELSIFS